MWGIKKNILHPERSRRAKQMLLKMQVEFALRQAQHEFLGRVSKDSFRTLELRTTSSP